MSAIAVLGYLSLVLGIYALVRDPGRREAHRFFQASRLKWDGFQPPFLMCWVYWFGVEKWFFGSKIRREELMASYLRYEFD
jgi:hypothetical protein